MPKTRAVAAKNSTTAGNGTVKKTKDVTVVPGIFASWESALAKRETLLGEGKEVVIYRRTNGPPSEDAAEPYCLWRQRYLQLKGDEYGWELGWDEQYNEHAGYTLFKIPANKYIPEKGDALAKAVMAALGGGGGNGPPSDVGPR